MSRLASGAQWKSSNWQQAWTNRPAGSLSGQCENLGVQYERKKEKKKKRLLTFLFFHRGRTLNMWVCIFRLRGIQQLWSKWTDMNITHRYTIRALQTHLSHLLGASGNDQWASNQSVFSFRTSEKDLLHVNEQVFVFWWSFGQVVLMIWQVVLMIGQVVKYITCPTR